MWLTVLLFRCVQIIAILDKRNTNPTKILVYRHTQPSEQFASRHTPHIMLVRHTGTPP